MPEYESPSIIIFFPRLFSTSWILALPIIPCTCGSSVFPPQVTPSGLVPGRDISTWSGRTSPDSPPHISIQSLEGVFIFFIRALKITEGHYDVEETIDVCVPNMMDE